MLMNGVMGITRKDFNSFLVSERDSCFKRKAREITRESCINSRIKYKVVNFTRGFALDL